MFYLQVTSSSDGILNSKSASLKCQTGYGAAAVLVIRDVSRTTERPMEM